MKSFKIDSKSFHLAVIEPAFQDLIPGGQNPYGGTLNDFTMMTTNKAKTPIINIKRKKNILQRRDASCDLVYKKLMGATTRIVTIDELYAATQICKNEFYQEALKDFRANDPLFADKILPFFKEAVKTDITTNSWFGDSARPDVVNGEWSTNKFDGAFKWIQQFYAAGVIPAGQSVAMPDVDMRANPAQAYNVLQSLVDRRSDLMRASFAPGEQAIYTTQAIIDGYHKYLKSLGNGDAHTFEVYANGVRIYEIDGIPIYPEPTWTPVLAELYGANKNAAVLTVRGNMVFANDPDYGEGEDLKTALMLWYEQKDLTWYFQNFLRCGMNIALPEHIVFSVSA